jgi:hypothetical protein
MKTCFVGLVLSSLESITIFAGGVFGTTWILMYHDSFRFALKGMTSGQMNAADSSTILFIISWVLVIFLLWSPRIWFPIWWIRSLYIRLMLSGTLAIVLMLTELFMTSPHNSITASWFNGPLVFMVLAIKWARTRDSKPFARACRLALPILSTSVFLIYIQMRS